MTSASVARVPARATVPRRGVWLRAAPAVGMLAWGGNHFTPLLVFYRQIEPFTSVEVDLFLATYVAGLVPGFLLAGPLSDRYGRKSIMFAGVVLGVLGSCVLAADPASVVVLSVGRLISGLAVAVGMVVGTAWIRELSSEPFDRGATSATAARRASLTLTIGFGVGAGVSGALAQWAPLPTLLPYLVHIALTLAATVPLLAAPESRTGAKPGARRRPLLADLGVPAESRRRFLRVIVPAAPWVFTAGALACAVVPSFVASRVGADGVAYAAFLVVLTLGVGTLIQALSPLITRLAGRFTLSLGILLAVVGTICAAFTATQPSLPLAIVSACVLGCGYGLVFVTGLVHIQAIAHPDDLAGVVAVFYCLTYVGFVLPVVMAALLPVADYTLQLVVLAAIGVACAVFVMLGTRHGATGPARSSHRDDRDEPVPSPG